MPNSLVVDSSKRAKTLILVGGPPSVGKTTIIAKVIQVLSESAKVAHEDKDQVTNSLADPALYQESSSYRQSIKPLAYRYTIRSVLSKLDADYEIGIAEGNFGSRLREDLKSEDATTIIDYIKRQEDTGIKVVFLNFFCTVEEKHREHYTWAKNRYDSEPTKYKRDAARLETFEAFLSDRNERMKVDQENIRKWRSKIAVLDLDTGNLSTDDCVQKAIKFIQNPPDPAVSNAEITLTPDPSVTSEFSGQEMFDSGKLHLETSSSGQSRDGASSDGMPDSPSVPQLLQVSREIRIHSRARDGVKGLYFSNVHSVTGSLTRLGTESTGVDADGDDLAPVVPKARSLGSDSIILTHLSQTGGTSLPELSAARLRRKCSE